MVCSPDISTSPTTRWRIGALLWALCFQFFIAEQLTRSAWPIPYSWSQHMISDLGAVTCGVYPPSGIQLPGGVRTICSPWHVLMNSTLVLQGLLIIGGALLLRPVLMQGRAARKAISLFLIAGASLIVVGLAPEDTGLYFHVAAATVQMPSSNLALMLLGVSLRSRKGFSGIGWASFVLGTIGQIALLLLITVQDGIIGPGILQRIGGYPLPLILTALGLYFLTRRGAKAATCAG